MTLSAVTNGSAGAASAPPAVSAELAQQLSDPQVAAALASLLDRLDVIALIVETLDGFMRRSETILDSAVSSAEELRTTVDATPAMAAVDLGETLGAAATLASALPAFTPALMRGIESGAIDALASPELVRMLETLSRPGIADSVAGLLEHLDLAVMLVQSLDGVLRRSETIMGSVIDSADDLRTTIGALPGVGGLVPGAEHLDLTELLAAGAALAAALPQAAPGLIRGMESGAIDALTSPALVHVLRLVSAGAEAGISDPSPVEVRGALSMARMLKDPDVSRALGFFATLARSIGKQLPGGSAAGTSSMSTPK